MNRVRIRFGHALLAASLLWAGALLAAHLRAGCTDGNMQWSSAAADALFLLCAAASLASARACGGSREILGVPMLFMLFAAASDLLRFDTHEAYFLFVLPPVFFLAAAISRRRAVGILAGLVMLGTNAAAAVLIWQNETHSLLQLVPQLVNFNSLLGLAAAAYSAGVPREEKRPKAPIPTDTPSAAVNADDPGGRTEGSRENNSGFGL